MGTRMCSIDWCYSSAWVALTAPQPRPFRLRVDLRNHVFRRGLQILPRKWQLCGFSGPLKSIWESLLRCTQQKGSFSGTTCDVAFRQNFWPLVLSPVRTSNNVEAILTIATSRATFSAKSNAASTLLPFLATMSNGISNWTYSICFDFVQRTKFHEKLVRHCCQNGNNWCGSNIWLCRKDKILR